MKATTKRTTKTTTKTATKTTGWTASVFWLAFALVSARSPSLAAAPIELPGEIPAARVVQRVGLTEIAVDYTSPAVGRRRIWGQLVPYGRTWTISPGPGVVVRFSRDVEVAGRPLAAGSYKLTAIPGKETWALLLEPGGLRVDVKPRANPHRERLGFAFSDFDDQRASLDLEWERLRVSVPIVARTARQVADAIERLDDLWRSYANAARFMLETEKDFDAGLRYADKSLALEEDWYTLWIKAALLAAKHDFGGAVEQGERAYALALPLGDAFVLRPDLERALGDWKKRR